MERGMTTASGGLLLGVVAAADEHVRGRLLGLVSGGVTSEVAAVSTQLRRAARFAAASGSGEEMALVLFVVAAVVLFGFMLVV